MDILLLLLVIFSVAFGLAGVFIEVWRAFRCRKRSLATAIAITCIAVGFPTIFAATYFAKLETSAVQQFFAVAGIVLMFGAGIFGAIGLLCDRRISSHLLATENENAPAHKQVASTDRLKP